MSRRVVITGMGIVSALGQEIGAAHARLKKFENCIETFNIIPLTTRRVI